MSIVSLDGPLDDRNELDPLRVQFVSEKAIDLAAALLVRGVHRAENVEVDLVLAEEVPSLSSPDQKCPCHRGPAGRRRVFHEGRRH